ncbi:MAG TPA: hydroxyacylglutathione hydrolase family protein [Planctomycetota bacterium]|nr:hydroxyacylglutathione hydrolase family protein [Planctomycetota bacterium]
MHLVFEQIRTGGDRNFAYLLGDRAAGECILIDPSFSPEACVQRAQEQNLKVTCIVNTHGHHDHINGNAKAAELTHAPVAAHPDCPALPDIRLQDEQELSVGTLKIKAYYTPGHCDDHIVFYEQGYRLLISGDLLFVGKVGGTKTETDARTEWNSLLRIQELIPEAATIWPGHDYGVRPSSTMAMERKSNPFLLCADPAAFIRLKDDWPIYKKMHGLK